MKKARWVLAALLMALLLSGCGDDKDSSGGGTTFDKRSVAFPCASSIADAVSFCNI